MNNAPKFFRSFFIMLGACIYLCQLPGARCQGDFTRKTLNLRRGNTSDPAAGIYDVRVSRNMTVKVHSKKDPLGVDITTSRYSIRPGDRMSAVISGESAAERVSVDADYDDGELLFIDKEKALLGNGRQVYFTKDTGFYVNGQKVNGADKITPESTVFLRIDPRTGKAGSLESIDLKTPPAGSSNRSLSIKGISIKTSPETVAGNYFVRKNGLITLTVKMSPKRQLTSI